MQRRLVLATVVLANLAHAATPELALRNLRRVPAAAGLVLRVMNPPKEGASCARTAGFMVLLPAGDTRRLLTYGAPSFVGDYIHGLHTVWIAPVATGSGD